MKRKPDHPQPSRQRRRAIGSRGRAGAKGTDVVPSAPSPSDTAQGPTPPRTRQLAMPQHSLSLLKFLNEDRIRQRFCDVSVSVGGKVYSAHKVVLAHGSSYFHAELSKNPDNGRVTLDHVDESVFQHLLGFLYTSECVVAEMELPALTEAARFLDMMEVLKLLCEEAGVRPATAIKKSGPPEVAVETETRGTKVRDPPSTMCSLSGLRFCTAKSKENHLAESDSGLQQAEPDKTVELSAERTAATRRSARRRRAPAKYERHQTEHSEGKQITLSPGEQDEYEGEEEPKGEVVKRQNPKLVASETSEPAQEEADEGREENEDGMSDKRPALQVRERGDGESPEGSDGEANRQQIVPETEANTPKGEGSNQAPPIYPEGLAPVILHTSSKKMLKCPKCDKTFDRTGKYESHTRVHTGEKPFQCDICLQRYSTKSNLTVHKKKHGADTAFQEKEHRCPFCNKLHASKKTLAKHVRRFHPDDIQEFLTMKKKKSEGWKCAVRA